MIANLTQHAATPAQLEAGVIEPEGDWKRQIAELLTVEELPSEDEILHRAASVAIYAKWMRCESAMIGGAPWLMGPLEAALRGLGIKPLYAFSVRRSIESHQPDGSVTKSQVFEHRGFIEAMKL